MLIKDDKQRLTSDLWSFELPYTYKLWEAMPETGDVRILPGGDVEWTICAWTIGKEFIESPEFDLQYERWYFMLFPSGFMHSERSVDVGLKRWSRGLEPSFVEFSFAVKGHQDTERRQTGVFHLGSEWYIEPWIPMEEYTRRKSSFFVNGHLTLVCRMKLFSPEFLFEEFNRVRKKDKEGLEKGQEASGVDDEKLLQQKLGIQAELEATRENLRYALEALDQQRKECEDARSMLERIAKDRDATRKELDALEAVHEVLQKEKLDLEANLEATRKNLGE